MILIFFVGCAVNKRVEAGKDAGEYIITGQKLLDQGDYEGALKENMKAISLCKSNPPGDEGLFNTGLIYAHYGYPKKDYHKALDYFKKLVKVYPQSPLAGEAKIWIEILRENMRLNVVIKELNQVINKSKQIDIEIDEKKKELLK